MADVEIRFGDFTDEDWNRISHSEHTVRVPWRKKPAPAPAKQSQLSAPTQPAPKPSSWSGLFGGKPGGQQVFLVDRPSTADKEAKSEGGSSSVYAPKIAPGDIWAALMSSISIDHTGKSFPLQLRGIYNEGNTCFMNAPLQLLLSCDALRTALLQMHDSQVHTQAPKDKVPLLTAVTAFFSSFCKSSVENGKDKASGDAVSAKDVYNIARSHSGAKELSVKGSQNDAEEFLGFLLSTLHDETSYECLSEDPEDGDEWAEVGEGNRIASINENKIKDSPIARIFRGTLRSTLHIPGSKQSVTLQPFFSLQLDIQNPSITSLEEALEFSLEPEHVHDVKAKNELLTTAMRALSIESLPPVLILHLKRFQFDEYGCQKISKYVRIPHDLEFNDRLLSIKGKAIPPNQRKYKLVSVIDHYGLHAEGGHYTCSALTPSGWQLFDDNKVYSISAQEVVRREQNRQAYIMVYKQCSS